MQYESPLQSAVLIKRYKRFLADVRLDDGEIMTVHTPNTGSMKGCCEPGATVWLLDSHNPKRKYRHSWELVQVGPQVLVGVNTHRANQLVREAIEAGVITELQGYRQTKSEVKYGQENSRIDLLLQDHPAQPDCYVEVKNVTLAEDGVGYFPDAVSSRGTKHLRELIEVVRQGQRAALVFCVQRADVERLQPADHIDALYGATLREAQQAGVLCLAYCAAPSAEAVTLERAIPVSCPALEN